MSSVVSPSFTTMALWAKSDRGKEPDAWHPLLCHLLDVSAACLELLELEPVRYRRLLANDTGLPPEQATAVVAALVGLHDLGKANPGFQRKSESCAGRVEAAGLSLLGPPKEIPHGIVSEAILAELLEDELGVEYDAALKIGDAVGAHHGFRSDEESVLKAHRRRATVWGADWRQCQTELFRTVWTTLGCPAQWPLQSLTAAAFQRLMGLTCVADWIGSSLDFAPYDGNPNSYLKGALDRAKARLQQVGWTRKSVLTEKQDFAELFDFMTGGDFRFEPRPLQAAVADLVENVKEPVLLIVEAAMGEGKTEASFYAHTALQRQLGHRGAYVGLPSQATGNAMFERLRDFLAGQGRMIPPDLQLLHGAAILSESYEELKGYASNLPGDPEQAVVARGYFTHLKRALLSEYGAGTIDQALLSILPVKHHFVRLWGLGNRTVILDEVHAYDTYTGELLNELLSWLKALGSSVILMSATLPRDTRCKMLEAFGAEQAAEVAEYPRVTMAHAGAVEAVTFKPRPLIEFSLASAPIQIEALAEAALAEVEVGGCMACIVNTVDRAQKLYREIRERDPQLPIQLFHARFPIERKQKLESEVLRLYGKGESSEPNTDRPKRAALVATQVVEQSLDLDFDVMLTDLAPVDLVLQRVGRLHRHSKNSGRRAGHEKARVLVSGLSSESITEEWSPTYWHKIYAPNILLRSWLALQRESVNLETDLDPLVQRVYNLEEQLQGEERFRDYLESATQDEEARNVVDSRDARLVSIGHPESSDWQRKPSERLPDDEMGVQLTTRKAEPNVTVVAAERREGQLYLGSEPLSLSKNPPIQRAVEIYQQTVKISRKDLVRRITEKFESPWTESGLLRRVIPLEFEDGCFEIGKTRLRMCPELGLVYEDLERVND